MCMFYKFPSTIFIQNFHVLKFSTMSHNVVNSNRLELIMKNKTETLTFEFNKFIQVMSYAFEIHSTIHE